MGKVERIATYTKLRQKKFRALTLLVAIIPAISMLAGCGGDDDVGKEVAVPAAFISANPPSGSRIAANESVVLTFDNPPADVAVTPGVATPFDVTVSLGASSLRFGTTVILHGPFIPGPLTLVVSWADGTMTLTYTVTGPDCCAARVTGGTVKDGDTDVDYEAVNSDRRIEITFSEEVTGNITLQTEAGEDVGWIGRVDGYRGILELVKGRELKNETTYSIVGKIFDALGDEFEVRVTFVTRGKA